MNRKSRALYKYWNSIRGTRPAPERSEIEPNDIRELLGDTFILEVDSFFSSVSFRLSGTRLCNAYGRELKGLGFMTLWDEQDNFSVQSTLRSVYDEHRPHLLHSVSANQSGGTTDSQFLLLPLSNQNSSRARILGLATCTYQSDWLGVQPVKINVLRNTVEIIPGEEPFNTEQDTATLAPNHVGENAVRTPHRNEKRVRHLTVIDGGRSE